MWPRALCSAADGEPLYEVARRHGEEVPTLCFDDRLEAFGGCRLCVVEVEGMGKPVASCTTTAQPGMVVIELGRTGFGLLRHQFASSVMCAGSRCSRCQLGRYAR